LEVGSFSYWFDKPWFYTEGRLVVVLIIPSSWVPNWAVIYTPSLTQANSVENGDCNTCSSLFLALYVNLRWGQGQIDIP
jgi:hypothetical protein